MKLSPESLVVAIDDKYIILGTVHRPIWAIDINIVCVYKTLFSFFF